MRTNQAMSADFRRMGVGTADDGVFHDNTIGAKLNRRAFGYDARAEHDAATSADPHIAADGGGRRYISRSVNLGSLIEVSKYHNLISFLFCRACRIQHRRPPSTESDANKFHEVFSCGF